MGNGVMGNCSVMVNGNCIRVKGNCFEVVNGNSFWIHVEVNSKYLIKNILTSFFTLLVNSASSKPNVTLYDIKIFRL